MKKSKYFSILVPQRAAVGESAADKGGEEWASEGELKGAKAQVGETERVLRNQTKHMMVCS